jgi:ABC-type dipeptide/oligopeptide/nickel transport system permease subunit
LASQLEAARSTLQWVRDFARRYPLSAVWGGIAALVVLIAILAPFISPKDPLAPNPLVAVQPPSGEYLFGTDFIGRDVLSRIIYGTRMSLFVAAIAVLVGTTAGTALALVSGFVGGKLDLLSQRLLEILLSFPAVLLALLLSTALGAGLWTVIVAIAATRVAYGTRIIRAQVLAVKDMPYVDAARSVGASPLRIMVFHIAPQCVAPFLVLVTTYLGVAIVLEATLGFLGAGIPPPTPTWGNMLGDASSMLMPSWHLVLFPGIAIIITVLSFNLLGDGLRDAFDPRLRGTTM